MTPPVRTDLSDQGLIEAIEADQLSTRVLEPEIAVEAHLERDVSWALAPLADPFRNVVLAARFREADADRRIADLVSAFDRAETPFVWWVSPRDTPADLGTRLLRSGLLLEGEAPGMAAEIAAMPLDEPPPRGLEIAPVRDAASLDEFLNIVGADWTDYTGGVITDVQRRVLDTYAREIPPRLAAEPVPLRWIGRVDGRAVATSRVAISAGVAGIYGVLTRPAYRGRGIGRAMTLAATRAAASLGYRIAVLQASELGYRVYERLGFREMFRYQIYWKDQG